MPTTPTLNVTDQTTWDRMMAAFHGSAAEYKDWLKTAIRNEVQARELAKMRSDAEAAMFARSAEFNGFLDTAT